MWVPVGRHFRKKASFLWNRWRGENSLLETTTKADPPKGSKLMALTQITEYQVQYSANKFPPRLWLKNGANFIGQLIFMPDGSALPADGESGGQVNL